MILPANSASAAPLMLNSYAEAEAWLLSITDYERLLGSPAVRYDTQTFDIKRFRAQLADLGDPHLGYAVIHVAGTKGKGSTCAFLEAGLRACGYKTGLYTSPHLRKFTERIQVNGCPIADEDFARLVQTMGARLCTPAATQATDSAVSNQQAPGFRTVFEILTASAFQHFAEVGIDIAIVETGLGGRLDSTNVFDQPGAGPLINIITAIGLDHMSVLGKDVATIAEEKAGIIQSHARIVIAPQSAADTEAKVRQAVTTKANTLAAQSPNFVLDHLQISKNQSTSPGYTFRLKQPPAHPAGPLTSALSAGLTLRPSLRGDHQANNAATALAALAALEDAQPATSPNPAAVRLDPALVRAGLESAQWPGRYYEILKDEIHYVIDGAHCPLSASALGQTCAKQFGDRAAVVVVGFLRDKTGDEILAGVFNQINAVHAIAVAAPTPRSAGTEHVCQALQAYLPSQSITAADNVADAIHRATAAARQSGGWVLVYGSLYLVGPALEFVAAKP